MITLTDQQVARFREAIEEASGGLGTVRSYSGRGMYGATCVAFTDEYAIGTAMSLIYDLMADDGDWEGTDLAKLLIRHDVHTDSLGLSTVVYWPTLGLPDTFVEDDE